MLKSQQSFSNTITYFCWCWNSIKVTTAVDLLLHDPIIPQLIVQYSIMLQILSFWDIYIVIHLHVFKLHTHLYIYVVIHIHIFKLHIYIVIHIHVFTLYIYSYTYIYIYTPVSNILVVIIIINNTNDNYKKYKTYLHSIEAVRAEREARLRPHEARCVSFSAAEWDEKWVISPENGDLSTKVVILPRNDLNNRTSGM